MGLLSDIFSNPKKNGEQLLGSVISGDLVKANQLLKKTTELNIRDNKGLTALQHALNKGYLEIAKLIIEKGAYLNVHDGHNKTPLLVSIDKEYHEITKALIEKGADLNRYDSKFKTALHLAIEKNDYHSIRLLIESGADLNGKQGWTRSSLSVAVSLNNFEALEILLTQTQKINQSELDNAFLEAFGKENLKMAQLLITHGANINTWTYKKESTLHEVSRTGKLEKISFLLTLGADINKKDENYSTPLYLAVSNKQFEVAKFLIDKGADINSINKHTNSVLSEAISKDNLEFIHYLIDKGINLNGGKKIIWGALNLAINQGLLEIAELLLNKGSNLYIEEGSIDEDYKNEYQESYPSLESLRTNAMDNALNKGYTHIAELLLNKGANENQIMRSENVGTILHFSAQKGYLKIVELLLNKGVNIDLENKYKETALLLSLKNRQFETAKFLIDKGAKIIDTYISTAVSTGNNEIINLIMEKGPDQTLSAALYVEAAVGAGNIELLNLIMEKGADLNLHSSLYVAAKRGHTEMVHYLIKKGANVNEIYSRTVYGWGDTEEDYYKEYKYEYDTTALHLALENGFPETALLLINMGANINFTGTNGKSPRILASEKGYEQVIQALNKAGAKL